MTADLDLPGNKIINPSEINMNRKLITNMDTDENNDLSAVNMITLKKYHPDVPSHTYEITKNIDLKEMYNVINSKQQSFSDLTTRYDSLVSYNDVKNIFLSREESFPMKVNLNMGNHIIHNIKNDVNPDGAVNKDYIDSENTKLDAKISNLNNTVQSKTDKSYVDNNIKNVNTKISNLVLDSIETEKKNKKYVDESHITSSTNFKDEFRYLMEDIDDSSSEIDIRVTGINDLASSPHEFNKKAYDLLLFKDAQNRYTSRIGFNLYRIPEGEYTICIEFFPVTMTNVSVDCVSTSLNVNKQSTKIFKSYTRSIINLHKWHISPPEYLMVDLKCDGTPESRTQGQANLIIYGIEGNRSDVPSDVYDKAFIYENNKMVMETTLDLNSHKLLGTTHFLNGYLNTANGTNFLQNGCDKIIIPNGSSVQSIKAMYILPKISYEAIQLQISHGSILNTKTSFTSPQTSQLQTIPINLNLPFGHLKINL